MRILGLVCMDLGLLTRTAIIYVTRIFGNWVGWGGVGGGRRQTEKYIN